MKLQEAGFGFCAGADFAPGVKGSSWRWTEPSKWAPDSIAIVLWMMSPSTRDFQATYASDDTTVYDNIIGHHFALDCCRFTDGQKVGANVAFNRTFYLDITSGFQIARDMQV